MNHDCIAWFIDCLVFSVPRFGAGAQGLDGDVDRMVANRQRALEVRVKREKYGEKGAVRARARADV